MEPVVGARLDGGEPHRVQRTGGAEAALRVAPDPEFREPADVAGQPERRRQFDAPGHGEIGLAQRLFVLRQQVQRVVARVHQREGKQVATGGADVGSVDRRGRGCGSQGRHGLIIHPAGRTAPFVDYGGALG
jgi:hypothetical protein